MMNTGGLFTSAFRIQHSIFEIAMRHNPDPRKTLNRRYQRHPPQADWCACLHLPAAAPACRGSAQAWRRQTGAPHRQAKTANDQRFRSPNRRTPHLAPGAYGNFIYVLQKGHLPWRSGYPTPALGVLGEREFRTEVSSAAMGAGRGSESVPWGL